MKMVQSYLENRKQLVRINNVNSKPVDLKYGVRSCALLSSYFTTSRYVKETWCELPFTCGRYANMCLLKSYIVKKRIPFRNGALVFQK